jgi:hypothetical protein
MEVVVVVVNREHVEEDVTLNIISNLFSMKFLCNEP